MKEVHKMKNKLSLNILSASIVAATLYLPTAQADMAILQTDITPNNTYFVAGYGKASISRDLDYRSGFGPRDMDTDVKVSTLNLISSGKATGSVTPLISMGTTIREIEDAAEKTSDFNIKAGLSLESGNKRHLVYAGYDVRGADYLDNMQLGVVFRATNIENTKAGIEIELNANFSEETDDISGGDAYTVSTNAKVMLTPQLFLTASVSLGYETDTEYDDGSSIETGTILGSELGLVLQANENIQLTGSIFNSFENQEYYDSSAVNIVTNEQIITGASLTLTLGI
jgi:hypothetical protein